MAPSAVEPVKKRPASIVENQDPQIPEAQLQKEAEFLHFAIFGRSAPEALRSAYVSANHFLFREPNKYLDVKVEAIVTRSIDIEAVEFALRRRTPDNVLSKKFLILCYLAEARSDHFEDFVNDRNRPLIAILQLSLHTLRSVYKLIKGNFLIWKYDVV